jgi:hypothetical protein
VWFSSWLIGTQIEGEGSALAAVVQLRLWAWACALGPWKSPGRVSFTGNAGPRELSASFVERRRHRSSAAARRKEGVLQCQAIIQQAERGRDFSRKADVRTPWAKGSRSVDRRMFFRMPSSGLRSASGFQNGDTCVVKTEKNHKEHKFISHILLCSDVVRSM